MWTRVGLREDVSDGVPIPTREGAILKRKRGPAQDVLGHVRRSIYSKLLSRGQHRYGADADCGVLDEGCTLAPTGNTTELSVCGGDAAFCQITLTTCSYT